MAMPYERILLTLDGSDLAARAIPHAALIAQAVGAQLVLLRVVEDLAREEPELMAAELNDQGSTLIQQQMARLRDAASLQLKQVAESLTKRGVDVAVEILAGNASEVIVDYAAKHEIDLIAMSTHGRSGLGRSVFGSVADRVLRRASCPVIMVRGDASQAIQDVN